MPQSAGNIVRMLQTAYGMELETIMNYLANRGTWTACVLKKSKSRSLPISLKN